MGSAACAVDQLISGKRLRLVDRAGNASGRRLRRTSRDAAISAPVVGSTADPTVVGATVRIVHPFRGEEDMHALPAAGWTARGKPAGSRGYTYRDRDRVYGPCTHADLEDGKLDVSCRGAPLGYTLDELDQQGLVAAFSLGSDSVLCMRFGGNVRRDQSTASRRTAVFSARNAPAPANCALP